MTPPQPQPQPQPPQLAAALAAALLLGAGGGFLVGLKWRAIQAYLLRPLARQLAGQAGPPPAPPQLPAVPCPRDALTVLSFGQSNAANSVQPPAALAIPANLLQYDWKSGRCHPYREPLLNADGGGGTPLTYALVPLAAQRRTPVLVVAYGRGASSVLEWAWGYLGAQHRLVLDQLRRDGITPDLALWHQGEADARQPGADAEAFRAVPPFTPPQPGQFPLGLERDAYRTALQAVVDRSRAAFPRLRFGVALASRCFEAPPWEPVRQAQRDVVAATPGAFISADSDAVWGFGRRYDDCHFNDRGARELGAQYGRAISRALADPPRTAAP